MKILAISDIHVNHPENWAALQNLSPQLDAWLIVAGDIADSIEDIEKSFALLVKRFQQVIWVPGNHDLWTLPNDPDGRKGNYKYNYLIELCQKYGVVSPEDSYPIVGSASQKIRILPLFILYDYSFRPTNIGLEQVMDWASEANSGCSDEFFLYPDPYPTRQDWCRARCDLTLKRLEACNDGIPSIIVNHFPLLEEFAYAPLVPRFTPWCGSRSTHDWHLRFNSKVVVTGHMHIPMTRYKDGVRFEDVSFGYPRQRWREKHIDNCLRKIWQFD